MPTPALSEVLALAMDKAPDYLAEITNDYAFEVVAFDQVAAVEAAIATSDARDVAPKRVALEAPGLRSSLTARSLRSVK